MKMWLAGFFAFFVSFTAVADSDPKAVIEPLKIARDTFYDDVSKFQDGKLTEEELVTRISEQFAPLINDRKVALRVMGRYSRQATEAERDRFTDRLESSLVDAYARGLAAYGGEQLTLPDEGIILKPGRAMVEARLESAGREALPIQFALGYENDKGWMVENVVIAGINLGLTLRNQFADLVKSTGSVAGAIDSWTFESVSAN